MSFPSYALIDQEDQNDSNFEALIDYKVKDFKEFSEMAEKLSEFRKQVKGINYKYNVANARVQNFQVDLQKIDEMWKFHHDNPEWTDKVMDLKNLYLKLVNYEEESRELHQLDEQKSLTELIMNEFKVQVNEHGMCMLCSEKPIGVFLDPCGHVCCQECWDRARRSTCPCCRAQVTSKKMFLI